MLVTSSQVKTEANYSAKMFALDEESVYIFPWYLSGPMPV